MGKLNSTILPEHLKLISIIDEFKGRWQALKRISSDRLVALKKVASIESVGSSTRIEGVKLSDTEIEGILENLNIQSFKTRDEEEVCGYSECMTLVFESHKDIHISENHIKQLHQELLKFSKKDYRHRGEYKKLPNSIEAYDFEGKSLGVIFETATPFDTPRKMAELVERFNTEYEKNELHPLMIIGEFMVHFLAIHPFQDGNGRLSRIMINLLLLKFDYQYTAFSSLEKIVEENKEQYYLALRKSQKTIGTDHQDLTPWITFFLTALKKQCLNLQAKIKTEELTATLPPLSQEILNIAKGRGIIRVQDAVKITHANRNTIKAHLKRLVRNNQLEQSGRGKGTWYKVK